MYRLWMWEVSATRPWLLSGGWRWHLRAFPSLRCSYFCCNYFYSIFPLDANPDPSIINQKIVKVTLTFCFVTSLWLFIFEKLCKCRYLQKVICKNTFNKFFLLMSWSGSISQRYGSPDPDPHQNFMDPQHWFVVMFLTCYLLKVYFSCKTNIWIRIGWYPGSGSALKHMRIHNTECFSPYLPSVLLSYHQNQCFGSGSGRIWNFWPNPD
jgi:hypothetical protein